MKKIYSVLITIFSLYCLPPTYAATINEASGSISNASIAMPATSGASETVSYKYYDKPWLMNPPPQELTLNEYETFQFTQYMDDHYLPLVASSPYQAKLQAMVDEIASATPRPYVKYTVKIVDKPEINAFVLPTGSIYVYNGLLKKIESDDELAGVLAHEIAHNVKFHLMQRISENMLALNSKLAGVAIQTSGYATLNPVLVALGSFTDSISTTILSEISIPQEDEADILGYEYIKKTHYSPAGILIFLQKFAISYGENEKELGIYMNHSLSSQRAKIIQKYMEQDGINIIIEKRKVLKISSVEVKEIEPGGNTARYKVIYNKINIISFTHIDANKVKATKFATNINQILNNSGEAYQLRIKTTDKTREIYYKDIVLLSLSNDDLANNNVDNIDMLAQDVLQKLKQVMQDDLITINKIGI